MGLIRFGGQVDYGDPVSSSFVEESLQGLGGGGISSHRSPVDAGERPVAIQEGPRHAAPAPSDRLIDCQSIPTSHAAVRHGVSWGKARRAEKALQYARAALDDVAGRKSFAPALSCWSTAREALAAAAPLDDRPGIETGRAPNVVRREPAAVQSLEVLREQTRSALDVPHASGRVGLSVRLDHGAAWQRLPEMERLGDFLFKHIEGIAAYCDHPVRFGVVESINTTIEAVLRRARGMRDEEMLVLN